MSTFGDQQEIKEYGPRIIYTGVENFKVRNVNLTPEEAKELYGDGARTDMKYTGTGNLTDDKEVPQLYLKFICDNDPEEGGEKIYAEPTFFVLKGPHVSQNGKTKYINAFGDTIWLHKEDADKKLEFYSQGENNAYTISGEALRPALKGEEEVVKFIRNLLNLPSYKKAKEEGNVNNAKSMFSMKDWEAMMSGNFTPIKQIVKNSTNKIGLLLGAKRNDEKVYQDVYSRYTLRQWVLPSNKEDKYSYLIKDVQSAQQNGAYGKTDFGPLDFKLRAYNADVNPDTQVQGGFGGQNTQTEEDNSTLFDADAASDFFEPETAEAKG